MGSIVIQTILYIEVQRDVTQYHIPLDINNGKPFPVLMSFPPKALNLMVPVGSIITVQYIIIWNTTWHRQTPYLTLMSHEQAMGWLWWVFLEKINCVSYGLL